MHTSKHDLEPLTNFGDGRYYSTNWVHKEIRYTGILLSDLVDLLNVDEGATVIQVTALDDYQVDIALADIEKWPVLLANQSDGNYMSIEDGGPIRIVWPYHAYEIRQYFQTI